MRRRSTIGTPNSGRSRFSHEKSRSNAKSAASVETMRIGTSSALISDMGATMESTKEIISLGAKSDASAI